MVARSYRRRSTNLRVVVPAEHPSAPRAIPVGEVVERARQERAHEDRDLVAAMSAGDPAMARAFHDRIRPQVDLTTCRLLGPRDPERDDVAQMALVELITTIDQYRGDCSLDSWVSIVSARVVY